MWKTVISLTAATGFFPQNNVEKRIIFQQLIEMKNCKNNLNRLFFLFQQQLWIKSKTGVDICGNITDVVLQTGIITLQRNFYFTNSVKDRGVVSTKFFTDIRKT